MRLVTLRLPVRRFAAVVVPLATVLATLLGAAGIATPAVAASPSHHQRT